MVYGIFLRGIKSFIIKEEKMQSKKLVALFSMVLVVLLLLTTVNMVSAKTLKIGMLHSLSGWFSGWDTTSLNEAQIVADMINERGGITVKGQSYKIELVVEDGKSSIDGVASAANALVYNKKVKFILGPAAFFARAMGPVVTPNKVINVLGYHTYTKEEIGPNQPYTFAAAGGAVSRLYSLIQALKERLPEAKNLCMVSPVGGIHPRLKKLMRDVVGAQGYNIVGEWVVFPDDAVDWSPYAAKINANKEADAVFWLHGITFHAGNMIKSAREIGYDKWFVLAQQPGCAGLREIAGEAAATKIISQSHAFNAPGNPPDLNELMSRMEAKYGKGLDTILESSNALYVLAQIIEQAQSLDPDVIKATWEGMEGQTVDSLFGPTIISGKETFGIKGHSSGHAWPVMVIDNGKCSVVGWSDSGAIP